MRCFVRRRALSITIVAALGGWLLYAPGRIDELRTGAEPLSVELPVTTGGFVESAVSVPVRTPYRLAIEFDRSSFERGGGTFDELKLLVGGMVRTADGWRDTAGVPVPIRWTVHDQATGAQVVAGYDADGGAEPPVGTAWSRADVRRVVAKVPLEPGRYVFRAEMLAPAPVLMATRPRLVLESWSKDSDGAGPRAFAMSAGTALIVRPVFVLALSYLVVVAGLALVAERPERARMDG